MTTFAQVITRFGGENLIQLYQLDLTPVGGTGAIRFTRDTLNGGFIYFMGVEYKQIDVDASGFEWNGTGPLPRPSIRVNNVAGLLSSYLIQYGDLVGAKLTRIRTFQRFLDGQPDAAEAPYAYTSDQYVIEQKSQHNKVFVEFKLASILDQQGRMLPGRQVVRDTCMWRYRAWDAALNRFDNGDANDPRAAFVTCPYVGSSYYDENDATVASPAQDRCSKKVSGCKVRFGANNTLPFGGFPGVARTR